jgi:hypothetical protein
VIFWYTGQPGHGKTLHAIDHALRLRDEGRLVYVGNVTEFDYAKARMSPITPEQFRDWMNFLPDGAVCLIDEAYEHGMLPKRAPGAHVPPHVEQLAKHRHRGLDFIFVSQSPQTQCDTFVHDLIEQQVHVRRMWGLPFVRLRKFFYMERNPLKATPNVIARVRLPKRPMGLYKSTAMDTTQRHVPWYVIALVVLVPSVIGGAAYMMHHVNEVLHGRQEATVQAGEKAAGVAKDGAIATAEPAPAAPTPPRELRATDYAAWLTPRIPGQPWTAPAYDTLTISPKPPRVFCMIGGEVGSADKTCTCKTEQGTRYLMDLDQCSLVAINGQYEPLLDEDVGDVRRMGDVAQLKRLDEASLQREAVAAVLPQPSLDAPAPAAVVDPLLGGTP